MECDARERKWDMEEDWHLLWNPAEGWVEKAEKKRTYVVWLQSKDEMSSERWYKEKISRTRGVASAVKISANEKQERRFTEIFRRIRKCFWRGEKVANKWTTGKEERVKAENGTLLIERDVVRKGWTEYFKRLLDVEEKRDPVIIAVGRRRSMKAEWILINREGVQETMREMKSRRATGLDGRAAECLKSGGTIVTV